MGNEITGIERSDPTPSGDMFIAVLKGIFGTLLPPVGQGIEAFANWRSRVKQERINEFFDSAIKEIEEDKVDYEFLRTDEFGDFLEDILIKVAANRSESKKQFFKNMLTQAVQGQPLHDMSRNFINILAEITESELQLLSQIYGLRKQCIRSQEEGSEADATIRLAEDQVEIFGIARSQYLLMVQSMIRKGLLADESFGRWGASPYDFISLNDLGMQFCEYISR